MLRFGENNEGPFEVIEAHPFFDLSEIVIGDERVLIANDILKKVTWS
ncbi:MAG: hypothetical protein V3574_04415 [Candidatus Moraniibacteriota bacterium]